MTKKIENGKNCKKKYAKIRDGKNLQEIPFNLKIIQSPNLNPRGGFLALEAQKKPKKRQTFSKKLENKQVLSKNY